MVTVVMAVTIPSLELQPYKCLYRRQAVRPSPFPPSSFSPTSACTAGRRYSRQQCHPRPADPTVIVPPLGHDATPYHTRAPPVVLHRRPGRHPP
eukprot:366080-Chlamydomonas_euryale.AAC.9